jgi:hypothetical protein
MTFHRLRQTEQPFTVSFSFLFFSFLFQVASPPSVAPSNTEGLLCHQLDGPPVWAQERAKKLNSPRVVPI